MGIKQNNETEKKPVVVVKDGLVIMDGVITNCQPDFKKKSVDLVIPAEVDGMEITGIGKNAFNSANITRLAISDGIVSIGHSAFYNCVKLKSVLLPPSVRVIDGFAFSECKKLEEVTIPRRVNKIAGFAFSTCKKLRSVIFDDRSDLGGNKRVASDDFDDSLEIGRCAFRFCKKLKTITLPDNAVLDIDVFETDVEIKREK